ncbi:HDOD domain-containing protein [Massilia sp. Mn16-1_5]|uniref:HDOD domain-containing protein n=1 Tax=Massilia sp. Mn16-1_5 TaxID=2079199 RepID=UPI00109E71DD|nr:HDOD domain-containing protein [Massilia sp. Mn16-1_5]THC41579.1 signal transduction protein [Massilia sp. Mn16-1_5]
MLEAVQPPDEGATRRVRAALMQKVNGDEEMFALGGSIARVIELADSDEPGTHDLAYFVLSDVALTQRILRLSNTIRYRTISGTAVTTVSRAIALLGFDNVKTTALAMLLVDTLDNGAHAGSVRVELEAALCASLVGREMARLSHYQGAEEAAIGALFKNLGALLVASHEHARYREIKQLTAGGKHTPAQASQMILGCSYDTLSAAVLAEWKIPEVIVRAQAALPPGSLKVAASRGEWMRQVASFSLDVARLLGKSGEPAATPEARALLARYGAAFELDAAALERLFTNVAEGMQGLMESMNLQPLPKEALDTGDGLPDVLMLATLDAGEEEEGTHPSGKPKNARELLLAGVQDVTQLRAGGSARVNDVILAVLETLYRALGFKFATVCLKDARAGQYRARVSFGSDQARVQSGFVFPVPAPLPTSGGRDLFLLAMENDADLMISDAASPKIRELLPSWHRTLLPDAKSFIVLPLVVGKAQLGFFYADRAQTAPEGVPPDETAMIRALKRQVLAALAAG